MLILRGILTAFATCSMNLPGSREKRPKMRARIVQFSHSLTKKERSLVTLHYRNVKFNSDLALLYGLLARDAVKNR